MSRGDALYQSYKNYHGLGSASTLRVGQWWSCRITVAVIQLGVVGKALLSRTENGLVLSLKLDGVAPLIGF